MSESTLLEKQRAMDSTHGRMETTIRVSSTTGLKAAKEPGKRAATRIATNTWENIKTIWSMAMENSYGLQVAGMLEIMRKIIS
jgi:hypothetical protein